MRKVLGEVTWTEAEKRVRVLAVSRVLVTLESGLFLSRLSGFTTPAKTMLANFIQATSSKLLTSKQDKLALAFDFHMV